MAFQRGSSSDPALESLDIKELHSIIGQFSIKQNSRTGLILGGGSTINADEISVSQPLNVIILPDYSPPARLKKPGLVNTFNFLGQKQLPNPWIDVAPYFKQMQLHLQHGLRPPIYLITGINGSGKSTLASYYASEWLKTASEKNVIWFDASSRGALARDFRSLYMRLDVGELPSNMDTEAATNFVYDELRKFPTLFIFDDAEDLDSILEYLPRQTIGRNNNNVRVIVTSQNTSFLNDVDHDPLKVIHLDRVSPQDRNKLLAGTLNLLPNGLQYDELEGAEFAEHFDSLLAPLISGTKALRRKNQKLAMLKRGETYTLRNFNDHIAEWVAGEKTMDIIDPEDPESPHEILFKPLRNLWQVEYSRFGNVRNGRVGMAVLDYLDAAAFMSCNGQPEEWMHQVFHEAQPRPARNVLENAVVYLQERSMVERTPGGGAVVAHKVVSMTRRGLKEQNRQARNAYLRALRERIHAERAGGAEAARRAGANGDEAEVARLIDANVQALQAYMERNNVL